MGDVFSKENRSEIMSKIRGKWTKIELEFQEAHPKAVPHPRLPHSPDFLLDGRAVFLDSSFRHGYVSADRFESLPNFWREKLFLNIAKDDAPTLSGN